MWEDERGDAIWGKWHWGGVGSRVVHDSCTPVAAFDLLQSSLQGIKLWVQNHTLQAIVSSLILTRHRGRLSSIPFQHAGFGWMNTPLCDAAKTIDMQSSKGRN